MTFDACTLQGSVEILGIREIEGRGDFISCSTIVLLDKSVKNQEMLV